MSKLLIIRTSLFSLLLLFGCTSTETAMVEEISKEWPKGDVVYEIFVQSFHDSNGDGIGDIPGMTQKLDYLQDLGVKAVWLMPIMPSPSYHKYDVTDYRAIHPDYGTMDDFKEFVEQAHKRDIRVVIDLIINHSASQHPWFLEASKGPDNPYRKYYVWANKDSIAEQLAKKEISMDSDNIQQWHAVNGDTTAQHYYGFFNGGMPDLNFDSQKVRAEVYDVGRFWLSEVGVDGFRLDAAKHIYPDDRAADSHAFWEEFVTEMRKVNPEVYTVGEVWASAEIQKPYIKGFSSLFYFDMAFSILETVKQGTAVSAVIDGPSWRSEPQSLVDTYIAHRELYLSINPDFIDATFLSNHDQNRFMSFLENDQEKAKLAASILLTLPGQPYLYYGEEIGMRGMKPDPNIREPFLWTGEGVAAGETSWIEPVFTLSDAVEPLVIQEKDPNSIYNHYKALIKLRNATPALMHGTLKSATIKNPGILAYVRELNGETVLVINNLSKSPIPLTVDRENVIYTSNVDNVFDKGSLFLMPKATVVLQ